MFENWLVFVFHSLQTNYFPTSLFTITPLNLSFLLYTTLYNTSTYFIHIHKLYMLNEISDPLRRRSTFRASIEHGKDEDRVW